MGEEGGWEENACLEQDKTVATQGATAVSYTHLTLPTTAEV